MIETKRDEQESLDSLIKRFRRQITKYKILQEVRQRAFFVSDSIKNRLKRKRAEGGKKRRSNKPINNKYTKNNPKLAK